MATCDICNADMGWSETTVFSIDDLQELLQRGYGPPDKVVRMALSAGWTREQVIGRWQQELDARPKPYWMFCPSCAKRANKYLPAKRVPTEEEAAAAEEEAVSETPAPDVSPTKPLTAEAPTPEAAEAPVPEEVPAEETAVAEEPQPAGKRPPSGRVFLVGLLVGLLGGGALYLLVVDRALHPVTPTPVATAAVLPTATTVPTTRILPTRRPATPRPTEALYPPTVIPVPDLAGAILTRDDLPSNFQAMTEAELAALGVPAGPTVRALGYAQARVMLLAGFRYPRTSEFVLVFFFGPLTPEEQATLDRDLAPASGLELVSAVLPELSFSSPSRLDGFGNLGNSSVGITAQGSGDTASLRMDMAVIRYGAVVEVVMVRYTDGGEPRITLEEVVGLLDGRVRETLGMPLPKATPGPDLSGVVLRQEDLPSKFVALTPAEMVRFGFTEEDLASDPDFAALKLANARPMNVSAFVDPTSSELMLVMACLVYPLTEQEVALADRDIANPQVGTGFWQAGIGGEGLTSVRVIEGVGGLGDGSAGLSAVSPSTDPLARMDMVLLRRGSAVWMIFVAYPETQASPVKIDQVARALDQRLAAALGE